MRTVLWQMERGGKRQFGRPRRRCEDNIKKLFFKKRDGTCTGLNSLTIWTGFCEFGNEPFGFHKMRGIS